MEKRTFRDSYEAVGRISNEFATNKLMYQVTALAVMATAAVVAKRVYDRWQDNRFESLPGEMPALPTDDNEVKGD